MISTQVSQFQAAVDAALPFANYMTMTPGTEQYVNIIVSSLYGALFTLAAEITLVDPEVGAAVAAIAAALLVDYAVTGFSWRTLEELSQQIDRQLTEIVDDNYGPAHRNGQSDLDDLLRFLGDDHRLRFARCRAQRSSTSGALY